MLTRFIDFCRKKLFASWLDSLLSLLSIGLIAWILFSFLHWALAEADWSVIYSSLRFLMAGGLEATELWRAWVGGLIFVLLTGLSLVHILRIRRLNIAWLSVAWVVGTIIMWNILIPSNGRAVGGLLLGTLVTIVAAIASFPLGVLLALGRNSRLPGIRIVCTTYIELVRSLPLISILFWAWMVVPLILPADLRINDIVRGAAGFTLFYAAYVAEYVRGGLQGIPAGQWSAARSLGMKQVQTLRYIVLPQAIRSVLPGLVGNVLDIFNNVPLLFIIGLTEFVRAGQVVLSNPQHSDQLYEVYIFMFAVYLLIATVLSWSSRIVERNASATKF